jgi:GH15 family glucan-1,4-alpha-glucosidase
MGRPVVLSNGQLFVGLDESGLVHDFYYPYVGLDNLTNARSLQHKIGVWADGQFQWTNNGGWDISVTFEPDSLISNVSMRSESLGIRIESHDFIDSEHNAFIRSMKVTNELDTERDIRVFMHQVFQISRLGRADTAMYVPDDHYILDYKGRCCLLIAGKVGEEGTFDQYAVGNYGIEGKAGTFMDAEDGELTDNNVEHGGVDSVLRFSHRTAGHESFNLDYWIVAADSQTDGQLIHSKLKHYPILDRLSKASAYWHHWLDASHENLEKIRSADRTIATTSLLIIKAHCDTRGSILASGDSSIFNFGRDYYCYCWPRDAAYAIWPLIRNGQFKEALNFFEFARDTKHPDGYLMHKYQPDRSIGSTWHPLVHGKSRELAIQEDETAIVVYMMAEYFKYSKDVDFVSSYYDSFIAPAAQFMSTFIDGETGLPHASYDLWEQKFLTNTYTVSTVIAALEAAARLADVAGHPDDAYRWRDAAKRIASNLDKLYHPDGYFRKGLLVDEFGKITYDDTLDISNLYGPFMFAGLDVNHPMIESTLQQVEQRLLNTSPIGGVIRFENDDYFLATNYKGNPWIVCTLWLAQIYIDLERKPEAEALLEWARQRALPSGVLSEQFDPDNGGAISVTPLVWSHAEFVNTVLDLSEIE